VYVKYRKEDHFSVIRGVNQNGVHLSDPSLGNITFSMSQFLDMWQTSNNDLYGKFLVIIPFNKTREQIQDDFFLKVVNRKSRNAVKQLAFYLG